MRSENEPTLYLKKQGKEVFIVVCLYVDDMIYFGSSKMLIDEFKFCMISTFKMTDLALLQYIWGLEVKQKKDGIFICQKKYDCDLLKKFHMGNYDVVTTPMNFNEKLQKEDGTDKIDPRLF